MANLYIRAHHLRKIEINWQQYRRNKELIVFLVLSLYQGFLFGVFEPLRDKFSRVIDPSSSRGSINDHYPDDATVNAHCKAIWQQIVEHNANWIEAEEVMRKIWSLIEYDQIWSDGNGRLIWHSCLADHQIHHCQVATDKKGRQGGGILPNTSIRSIIYRWTHCQIPQ